MRKCLVLILITLFCYEAHARGREEALCTARMLGDYAWEVDLARTNASLRAWLAYKNSPGPVPITVDLSNPSSAKSTLLTRSLGDWNNRDLGYPTVYEEQVLHLRKGDTVVYDGVPYVIGDFLGAGNSTHVFALANYPGKVIRIPFLIRSRQLWGQGPEAQQVRLDRIFSEVALWVKKMEQRKGHPGYEVDPQNRFVIADRVMGSQSGLDFLQSIYLNGRDLTGSGVITWDPRFPGMKWRVSPQDSAKLRVLIELMTENGQAHLDGSVWRIAPGRARQYVYDDELGEWRLVDSH